MADPRMDKATASYAEEAFVVDVQSFLHQIMEEKGVSRAQLARAMGVSRARVTQVFSDECKNFTVRLLARAVHALGEAPRIVRAEAGCDEDAACEDACPQAAVNLGAVNFDRVVVPFKPTVFFQHRLNRVWNMSSDALDGCEETGGKDLEGQLKALVDGGVRRSASSERMAAYA